MLETDRKEAFSVWRGQVKLVNEEIREGPGRLIKLRERERKAFAQSTARTGGFGSQGTSIVLVRVPSKAVKGMGTGNPVFERSA